MLAALLKGYAVDGEATDLVSGLGLQFLKNLLRLSLRCQSHDEDLAQKFANGERLGKMLVGMFPGNVNWAIIDPRYKWSILSVFEFSNFAKPAFNWSKQKTRAVSTCRIHVTNIKIFKIPLLIN